MVNPLDNDSIIQIEFSFDDINAVKVMRALAVNAGTTYLTLENDTVLDMAGNGLVTVESLFVDSSAFTPDSTKPTLTSFDLVMTNGTEPLEIVLRFSEAVDVGSLRVNLVTLHLSNTTDANADYTLREGTVPNIDSPNVTISVSEEDLNEIRDLYPLASSKNTSYLSLLTGAVRDMGTELIDSQDPINVNQYTSDLVRPFISEFSLDMNNGILELTFSEEVQVDTFALNDINLQANLTGGDDVTLTTSSNLLTTGNSNILSIEVSPTDLNSIKELPFLATEKSSTYLVLTASVRDIANNFVLEIESGDAKMVDSYFPDETSPKLQGFDLNMLDGILTLQFDETVNSTSTFPSHIEITNMDSSLSYALTDVDTDFSYSDEISLIISTYDHNQLKALDGVATTNNNTFLNLFHGAILDMNGNPVQTTLSIEVSEFTKDDSPPSLMAFDIDMDNGFLVLSFDETVNVSSLQLNQLELNDYMTSFFNLNSSEVLHGPSASVNISLSKDDLNELKRLQICLSTETCAISFPETFVRDMVSRAVIEVNSVPVLGHTKDMTGPTLVEFIEFNIPYSQIVLLFSETVDVSTFNVTQLTLQSFFEDDIRIVRYTLTNSTVEHDDNSILKLTLSQNDLFSIKETSDLCDRRSNCYMVITNLTIRDMSNNTNAEILQQFPGRVVTRFIDDINPPSLESFNLDMDEGLLSLFFSEPVAVKDIDPTGISLLSMANASIFEQYPLTGGTVNGTNGDTTAYLYLSEIDRNSIKSATFAKSSMDTFLIMTSTTITDVAFDLNPVIEITVENAELVDVYKADDTSPKLESFELDLSHDHLVFTFNEPVQTMVVAFTEISLLNNSNTSTSFGRTLVGGTVLNSANNSLIITVLLHPDDISILKLTEDFGTTENNTYVSLGAGAFFDTAGVGNDPLSAMKVTVHGIDSSVVQLASFSLDVQTGELILTFNDIVLANTLDASAIGIQSKRYSIGTEMVTLTSLSSNTSSSDGYEINISIHPLDLLAIKSVSGLATDNSTTWLTLQAYAIDDAFGNDVLAITNGKAIQVNNFSADVTDPAVSRVVLDLDNGELRISFTDTIDHTLLNVSLFTIVSDTLATYRIQLNSSAEVDRTTDGKTALISLIENDLNEIKNNSEFGTSESNTLLVIGAEAIPDLAGNYLPQIPLSLALPADEVVDDTSGPELRGFELDLNSGEIVVTFSEPIDSSTVVASGFILQSKADITFFPEEEHIFDTGTSLSPNGPVIAIQFEENDLNAIFAITALGNSVDDTYLRVTSAAVNDVSGNPADPVPFTDAVPSNLVTPDTNAPSLQGYYLDMDIGVLSLTFSEVVLTSTVNFDQFTLHSTANGSSPLTTSYTLTGGTTQEVESKTLNITISDTDLFAIQMITNLATMLDNVYLSFTNESAMDAQDYSVIAVSENDARLGDDFVPDSTPTSSGDI